MRKILILLGLSFGLIATAIAQDSIEVKKVDFKTTADDWIQMEVEMKCGRNEAENARDSRFVENVTVKVFLAYESRHAKKTGEKFDYYSSEVDVVIMEQGKDYNVYFYLPGLIVERDQIQPQEPTFYYVEVSVNGAVQSPKPRDPAMSQEIKSLDVLNSFKAQAAGKNEHLLLPIYLTPAAYHGRVSDLPIFLRRDVR